MFTKQRFTFIFYWVNDYISRGYLWLPRLPIHFSLCCNCLITVMTHMLKFSRWSSLSQGPGQEWLSNKCPLLFRGRGRLCRLQRLQLTHPFTTPESNQWWTLGQPCSPATRERWVPFAFKESMIRCAIHTTFVTVCCSVYMLRNKNNKTAYRSKIKSLNCLSWLALILTSLYILVVHTSKTQGESMFSCTWYVTAVDFICFILQTTWATELETCKPIYIKMPFFEYKTVKSGR